MPIYEYRCTACGGEFEELVRSTSHERELRCTACDSAKIERKLSVPAAPQTAAASRPLPTGCGNCATNPSCPFND
jgi:putative FmdB family regulatory protein